MTTLEILHSLQSEIHSAVFATLDDRGLPQTCVIDLMLADEGGLYFLTAKGKSFYERLMARPFVALSGMKGGDTLSMVAISLRGAVRNIGKERLAEIFVQNPYMAKIYPTEKNREALEVFQIFRAEGEYFDLSQLPPYRKSSRLAEKLPMRQGTGSMWKSASAALSAEKSVPQTVSAIRPHVSWMPATASTAATASEPAQWELWRKYHEYCCKNKYFIP